MENLDRDEFERRLKNIFSDTNAFSTQDAINALLKENKIKQKEYKDKIEELESKVDGYLAAWDAATTPEERQAVVGSVKK